ncbi:MAG: Mannose-1-phosphate guanylyltransferase (GDP), partial [uncultured Gemmatimonadetes bacterium]
EHPRPPQAAPPAGVRAAADPRHGGPHPPPGARGAAAHPDGRAPGRPPAERAAGAGRGQPAAGAARRGHGARAGLGRRRAGAPRPRRHHGVAARRPLHQPAGAVPLPDRARRAAGRGARPPLHHRRRARPPGDRVRLRPRGRSAHGHGSGARRPRLPRGALRGEAGRRHGRGVPGLGRLPVEHGPVRLARQRPAGRDAARLPRAGRAHPHPARGGDGRVLRPRPHHLGGQRGAGALRARGRGPRHLRLGRRGRLGRRAPHPPRRRAGQRRPGPGVRGGFPRPHPLCRRRSGGCVRRREPGHRAHRRRHLRRPPRPHARPQAAPRAIAGRAAEPL